MMDGLYIDEFGDKKWYKNKLLHREDGPAIETVNGNQYWYLNGMLHRKDGPAIEYANGTKYWYKHGNKYRKDGPTIEYANGNNCWYKNGILYKLNDHYISNDTITEYICMECELKIFILYTDYLFYSPIE